MNAPAPANARVPLRMRGRSFLALALAPVAPLDAWLASLDDWCSRSPAFFTGRPVVLDLTGIGLSRADLTTLVQELAQRDIRIMAIEGVAPGSLPVGLPPAIANGRDAALPDGHARPSPPRHEQLVIEEPVRSGQSVFFPAGDVVVIGSVASGAEIVAGGSIHVYGTLRGRAIAGVAGRPDATIFCRTCQAELVAVDGIYKAADDIDPVLMGRSVWVRAAGDLLVVAGIG